MSLRLLKKGVMGKSDEYRVYDKKEKNQKGLNLCMANTKPPIVELPPSLLTVSETLYSPGVVYVWVGLVSVEVSPSPKDQRYDEGSPVDRSVNPTVSGGTPYRTS